MLVNNHSVSVVIVFFLLLISCLSESDVYREDILHRSRRQLLFPNTTLLQLNAGVGTPTPLKDININWAFQANFQLPWNRTQIPTDILNVFGGYDGETRKKRQVNIENDKNKSETRNIYENDAKLYHFYKYIEDLMNSFGHNGTSCVLHALCQIGAEPLYSDDKEDLLHELAIFVLNPTNDVTEQLTEKNEVYPYVKAYKLGEKYQDCSTYSKYCSTSLVDMFGKLH